MEDCLHLLATIQGQKMCTSAPVRTYAREMSQNAPCIAFAINLVSKPSANNSLLTGNAHDAIASVHTSCAGLETRQLLHLPVQCRLWTRCPRHKSWHAP